MHRSLAHQSGTHPMLPCCLRAGGGRATVMRPRSPPALPRVWEIWRAANEYSLGQCGGGQKDICMRAVMPEGRDTAPAHSFAPATARELPTLWRGAAPSPLAGQRLAQMRLRNGWRLLAVVGLGILLGVLLTGAIPQYDTLVANVQVQSTIAGMDPPARNVEIRVLNRRVAASDLNVEDTGARALGTQYLSGFTQPAITH